MITEAADVHGAQASAITRTEGFYRPEVDELFFGAFISVLLTHISQSIEGPNRKLHILRYVGSLGVLALFCLAGVRSRNSSFRRRSIVHIPPLHSPMRSGTPSVNWDDSTAGNPSTTTPCCQINRARFSPSMRPMSAFLLGNTYGEKQQFHSFRPTFVRRVHRYSSFDVLALLSPFGQRALRICARMVSMYRLPCGSACLQTVL
jgi:hypothetical protein